MSNPATPPKRPMRSPRPANAQVLLRANDNKAPASAASRRSPTDPLLSSNETLDGRADDVERLANGSDGRTDSQTLPCNADVLGGDFHNTALGRVLGEMCH